MSNDPYDLERFIAAHDGDFSRACEELRRGHKETHWIWYIFPQMAGLGQSKTSEFYGIRSLDEARAFLAHPILGPRLEEVTRIVLAHCDLLSLHEIFGAPDDQKFRSSMTLFVRAAGPHSIYAEALEAFCGGQQDQATLRLLA